MNSFTLAEIYKAHDKIKTGADFPHYIQGLKDLGVSHYQVFLRDGHTEYYDKDGNSLSSPAMYNTQEINSLLNKEKFLEILKIHQRGESDYSTFCGESLGAGVSGWIMDLTKMTCTYTNEVGHTILEEEIPSLS